MNKTQIVSALAEKAGISKVDAANYVNTIFGVIADNMVEGDGLVAVVFLTLDVFPSSMWPSVKV